MMFIETLSPSLPYEKINAPCVKAGGIALSGPGLASIGQNPNMDVLFSHNGLLASPSTGHGGEGVKQVSLSRKERKMSEDFGTPQVADAAPKKTNVWLIVGIVVGVIVLLLCCCVVIALVFPAMLGPVIENVFSNIIEGLGP
jgi:hypothetical protein